MKILYVSQYFPPEMGAPAARVSELARYWSEAGHEVSVLTGFPNHPTGKLHPEYRARWRRLISRERFGKVRVVRTWLMPLPNRKAMERILNYSSFFFSAAITGMFLNRADVVIGTSPQLLVALAAWWIAAIRRIPFVFEVRDLWPESLGAVGVGSAGSVLHRVLGRIAGFLYRRSDLIVVVTPAFRTHLISRWRVPADKIEVVANGVNTELFNPDVSGDEVRAQFNLDGKFVVAYIGTMGMAHGVATILEAAEKLKDNDGFRFLFVGEGAEKEKLVALARDRMLKNLVFVSQQPRERVPQFIRASDACVVPLLKTEVFQTVIPTKLLEFMACGRPVILMVEGQARELLVDAGGGLAVEPENGEALASAIGKLQADPDLSITLGRNGRNFIVENLTRERTAEVYSNLLQHRFLNRVPEKAIG